MRVVSLLPAATEILARIGGQSLLVGRSHECDHPAAVVSLPVVSRPAPPLEPASPDSGGIFSGLEPPTPGAIHAAVADLQEAGQPLYTLDQNLLAELKPDLILTQGLCEVCAIDREALAHFAADLPSPPEILELSPTTVEDMLDDVLRVGAAVGKKQNARNEVVALRGRLHSATDGVNQFVDRTVVGFMEWTDPIFVAGHWTVQLIERAGGWHPLNETVAKPGSGAAVGPQQAERVAGKSIAVPNEVFAATKPEALILAPCGIPLEQVVAQAEHLRTQRWFNELPAVRNGRVALVDGHQMFNRPGPRLVDALEWMCGWLNDRPELIPADFPWQPMKA